MNFKPNPKAQVQLKFAELFGSEHSVEVRGSRIGRDGRPCSDQYLTQVVVDGNLVAYASHKNWRESYKMLLIEVEKLYADGLALV